MGSFLNVVILRLPDGRSIVTPRSSCPACGALIRWHDNVPVLSWLLLRGRCRSCRGPIAVRYAVVEAATGALFALAAWAVVDRPGLLARPEAYLRLLPALFLLGSLLAASVIDLDRRLLPDAITLPGAAVGLLLTSTMAPETLLLRDPWLADRLLGTLPAAGAAAILALAGFLAGWGVLRVVAWAGEKAMGREAMGLGDAKFLGMIGTFVGPVDALLALVLASFAGTVVGLTRLLFTRDREIPFGPFLALGGAVLLLFHRDLRALLDALVLPK